MKRISILMSIALALLLFFGCEKKGEKEAQAPSPKETETVSGEAVTTSKETATVSQKTETVPGEVASSSREVASSSREVASSSREAASSSKEAASASRTLASKRKAEEKKAKVEAEEIVLNEGIVTFLSGKVSVNRGNEWRSLDVEDPVGVNDRVKTGADSFCEIQFTDFGIIRVQDNSEILVRNVYLKEAGNKVDVNLKNGNLLCKVSKLSKGEDFSVRTNTALAGVRGTEFIVREEAGKATVVAVNEGRVSVVPSSILDKIESLRSELKTETAKEVLDEIAIPEIIVTDKKEVVFEQQEVDKIVKKFEEVSPVLEQKIKEIDRNAEAVAVKEEEIKSAPQKSSEEKAKELAEVQQVKRSISALRQSVITQVDKKTEEIQQKLEKPEAVSKTSLKELQEIKRMKPREITVASKEGPEAGPPGGTGEEKSKAERRKEEAPSYVKITIEVSPKDAVIYVNDEDMGKTRYSGLFAPGTILVIRAVREGYKTNIYKYTVTDERHQRIAVELKSPVSWELKSGNSPFVRKVAYSGGSAVLADSKGKLVCVSIGGKELWTYATKNDPNENSMPVIVDDRVIFSGAMELVVLSMRSGELVKQITLGKGKFSSHLFGRRVVSLNGSLLFPSDDALVVLSKSTLQETGSIDLPGASYCSPALYGEKVVIVNQKGELLIIDPESGEVEASIETDTFQPASLAPAIIGNVAVFADTKGNVAAVNLDQMSVLWQRNVGAGQKGVFTDIEFEDDRLYVYTGEEFYTISLQQGKDLFSSVRSSCLPLVRDKKLFYGDSDGRFLMVDALTGSVLKSYAIGSPITVQPLLVEGGLLFGTGSGAVGLLNLEDL